jgi:hypothetical protein
MKSERVPFFSKSFVSDVLRSSKYLESHARDAYVNARGSSCKVCILLGQIDTRWNMSTTKLLHYQI